MVSNNTLLRGFSKFSALNRYKVKSFIAVSASVRTDQIGLNLFKEILQLIFESVFPGEQIHLKLHRSRPGNTNYCYGVVFSKLS